MMRAMIDLLRPDGRFCPLSDTKVGAGMSSYLAEIGLKRYPELFEGKLPALRRGGRPTEYAAMKLAAKDAEHAEVFTLNDICYPRWMTAFLRNGAGRNAAVLAMPFNLPGGHRQRDNLALYYADYGRTILGDQGYVGDTPMNRWIRCSRSHNLVIVDDADQSHKRSAELRLMAASPEISVVEAASNSYSQCSEYRRLIALVKGPEGRTFAIDIFRVRGGKKHDYRIYSELASSDAGAEGSLAFPDFTMPKEPPLPRIGGSLKRNDIFGLRDARQMKNPPMPWRAVWRQGADSYRLWMLSPVDIAQASNGPGQQSHQRPGRRVRYVDAIRQGAAGLASAFVAVHEPGGAKGAPIIRKIDRLAIPASAGPAAIALRIESAWGAYLVMSEFEKEALVGDVRFQGAFGVICDPPDGRAWLLGAGATTLARGDFGFSGKTARWQGKARRESEQVLRVEPGRPADWPKPADGCYPYTLVKTARGLRTGFAITGAGAHTIRVARFPLPEAEEFAAPAMRFMRQ